MSRTGGGKLGRTWRRRRNVLPVFLASLSALAWSAAADSSPLAECVALLAESPGDAREAAHCAYTVAVTEDGEGPATSWLERKAPEDPWFPYYLGHRWYGRQDEKAAASYLQAAEAFERTGDLHQALLSRINRNVLLLLELQRVEDAQREIGRLLRLAERSSVPGDREAGEIARARLLFVSGDGLARAEKILESLEIPATAAERSKLEQRRLLLLSEVAMASGHFRQAREHLQSLLEMDLDGRIEASTRLNLAWAAYEILREEPGVPRLRREAIALAEAALEVAEKHGVPRSSALAAWYLGTLTPGAEGRRYLERCHETAPNAEVASHCLNALAVALASDRPERARELIEESRRLVAEAETDGPKIRVLQQKMSVDWATLPPERALTESHAALSAIEALRDRQEPGSEAQAGVFSVWSDEYGSLAGWLLEAAGGGLAVERAVGEAFRVTERKRARALTDWLRTAHPAGESSPDRFADLDAVRAALGPDEAVLSFQVAPWRDVSGDFAGGSWLFAITRDRVTVHRLPGRVEVRNAVESFEGAVTGGDDPAARSARVARYGAVLHDDLLADALAELPERIDRLILLPDDALHRLPFAALRSSEGSDPVGARYQISRAPSATLWLRWRRAPPKPAAQPILVFADPELPAAERTGSPTRLAQADGRPPTRTGARPLESLRHARREGRTALRALGGGHLLLDAKASEAACVRLPLGEFSVVHFGAHAIPNIDHPERSAVILAPSGPDGGSGTGGKGDDGYLRAAEIAGLDLDGRLVVLAVCQSADGQTLRGEGVMSLARAFFQAGAHTVVASLWRLRDDESAAMFERFYRHLGRGESVAAALHAARREAIEAGEPAAAWAGLVVLGDGSLVPVPGGRRGFWDLLRAPATLAILLAVLAAAVLAAARHRRRARLS